MESMTPLVMVPRAAIADCAPNPFPRSPPSGTWNTIVDSCVPPSHARLQAVLDEVISRPENFSGEMLLKTRRRMGLSEVVAGGMHLDMYQAAIQVRGGGLSILEYLHHAGRFVDDVTSACVQRNPPKAYCGPEVTCGIAAHRAGAAGIGCNRSGCSSSASWFISRWVPVSRRKEGTRACR